MIEVFLSVDVEPDCPPYLWTWRGIEEGMPKLLALFASEGVPGTFFTTGATAQKYPACVEAIVAGGHELACHGYSHMPFRLMSPDTAQAEIATTNAILRRFAPVTSFRAPYLSFPEAYVGLLHNEGITLDASRAAYKINEKPYAGSKAPQRMSASVTASVLRLPHLIRDPWLKALKSPVSLFVHPWEFVDLTGTDLRLDCRFRTGQPALDALRSTIALFKARGAVFRRMRENDPQQA